MVDARRLVRIVSQILSAVLIGAVLPAASAVAIVGAVKLEASTAIRVCARSLRAPSWCGCGAEEAKVDAVASLGVAVGGGSEQADVVGSEVAGRRRWEAGRHEARRERLVD